MKLQSILISLALFVQAMVLAVTWNNAYYPTDPGPDSGWQKVYLELQPVDPRSLFQGNYVELRYGIHSLPRSLASATDDELASASFLYVSLAKQGREWKPTKVTLEPPAEGVFIRGRLSYVSFGNSSPIALRYSIEQFYAPKDDAMKLEQRSRRVWNGPAAKSYAEVVINREGRAGLVDIVLDSEVH